MNSRIIILSIILSVLINSCGSPNEEPSAVNEKSIDVKTRKIETMHWLVGKWQNPSDEGIFFENWIVENDSLYKGVSGVIKNNDTSIFENVSLQQIADDLFYVPVVKDQNDGKPVMFKMTSSIADKFVFENPEHDFPKKITYEQKSHDSLLAEISGMVDGKQNSQYFPFVRVK